MNALKSTWLLSAVLFLGCQKGDVSHEIEANSTGSIQLELIDGTNYEIEKTGSHATLLAFWSTSCLNCIAEIPALAKLHEASAANGISVVAVNAGEPTRRVSAFLEMQAMPYPVAVDRDRSLMRRFEVEAVPTFILLDQGTSQNLGHRLPENLSPPSSTL